MEGGGVDFCLNLAKFGGRCSCSIDVIFDALRSKISRSAHGEKSDPECENGPNGVGLDAVLFWASGTQ